MTIPNPKARVQPYPQITAKLHPQIALVYKRGFLTHVQAATLTGFDDHEVQLRLLRCLDRHIFDDDVLRQINLGAKVLELPDGEILFLPSRFATGKKRHAA